MKLHLGCGQKYLEGYVNIDYPSSYQTVQRSVKVDKYGDILELSYPRGSIEEVRLHHVFEHFPRPAAAALVAAWNSWLVHSGILRIEVPDFEKTGRVALSRIASAKKRKTALRHLYGSHEAPWAVHYEGYSAQLLSELLNNFGFRTVRTTRNSWRGTYNVEIFAAKEEDLEEATLDARATRYFRDFLVSFEDEKPLLATWIELFRGQFLRSKASDGNGIAEGLKR